MGRRATVSPAEKYELDGYNKAGGTALLLCSPKLRFFTDVKHLKSSPTTDVPMDQTPAMSNACYAVQQIHIQCDGKDCRAYHGLKIGA
jgi:hypothetical protein